MTKEEVLKSIGLKKRFCKDCNLPINLFDEPYFTQRLVILDSLFGCIDKFNVFCRELEQFENEQEYFAYYNTVKDSVINMIRENSMYQKFSNDTFSDTQIIKRTIPVGKKNLYIDENDGKSFISIDMKKANFSALRHYSPDIFKGRETWEAYISLFTNHEHIKNSKYIRQVILGALNPKKQITYETYLMDILYLHIKEVMGNRVEFYSIGVDEIVICADNAEYSFEELKSVVETCQQHIGQLVRVVKFDLKKVGDYGWIKILDHDEVEFKTINADIFHQIVKHYWNEPIDEDDLVFYYNGQLARFLKAVDNPWR